MVHHFQTLAYYNRIANERLYETCALLPDEEYRKSRAGSFGSIHNQKKHKQQNETIWLARFEGGGAATPALNSVLYDEYPALRAARAAHDARIEAFFAALTDEALSRAFPYVNNQVKNYVESAPVAFSHFFNHQTHHRGQITVMLSQTPVKPPSLDLHRIK